MYIEEKTELIHYFHSLFPLLSLKCWTKVHDGSHLCHRIHWGTQIRLQIYICVYVHAYVCVCACVYMDVYCMLLQVFVIFCIQSLILCICSTAPVPCLLGCTYPKPWLLSRALLGSQEENQPVYWSWLEQVICSGLTDPASKPRGLWYGHSAGSITGKVTVSLLLNSSTHPSASV